MIIGKRLVIVLAAAALAFPTSALAQGFSTGQNMQSTPVWEQFDLDKEKRIKLTFRKASSDMVLELFSRESGITIVKDPKLTDKVTLVTPKAVDQDLQFSEHRARRLRLGLQMPRRKRRDRSNHEHRERRQDQQRA